jgi:hypothetical protein
MSNPHPEGPGFVFRVSPLNGVTPLPLIEALHPLVFFQGFPSLAFGVSSPQPQGSGGSAYLLAAFTRQVTRPSWKICDF